MKMTLQKAKDRLRGLASLGALRLPAKLNYAINFNMEKLEQEVQRADKERIRLCKQYAKKDENGEPRLIDSIENGTKIQSYDMTTEDEKKVNEEVKALMEEEVEFDLRTVKMELIEQCEQSERYDVPAVGHLNALYFMLAE